LSHLFGQKPCSCPEVRVPHCHRAEVKVQLLMLKLPSACRQHRALLYFHWLHIDCGFFVSPGSERCWGLEAGDQLDPVLLKKIVVEGVWGRTEHI